VAPHEPTMCWDMSLTTAEDKPSNTAPNCTDVDNDSLTYAIASQGTKATASVVSGQLHYVPDSNTNGADSFTYTANDGHVDSAPATVNVTITAVNDAPSFIKGANQTVNEDAGAQTVDPWASAISKGPADESSQVVHFEITNNT